MFLHTEERFDFFLQSKPYFWFDKVVEWLLQIIIFFIIPSLKISKQFFKDWFTSMGTVQSKFVGFDLDFFLFL